MTIQRPVICIIGSGTHDYPQLTRPIGEWLAARGYDLVHGGGEGVMAGVSKAFAETPDREGQILGIIPAAQPCDTPKRRANYSSPKGYPNPFVDIPIYTHLHLSGDSGKEIASRNAIIILTADVLIAFPGQAGTRSEIQLALEYGKPLVILNPDHEWDEFRQSTATMAKTVEEVLGWLEEWFNKKK